MNNFVKQLFGGRQAELTKGDIDERGLEVGKTYFTRDIKAAERRYSKHLVSRARKARVRNGAWIAGQRDRERDACLLVRAYELEFGLGLGGAFEEAADKIQAERRAEMTSRAHADVVTIASPDLAGLRPTSLRFSEIVNALDLERFGA